MTNKERGEILTRAVKLTRYRIRRENVCAHKNDIKGRVYGKCNVTDCQNTGDVVFYNRIMNAYYCSHCAIKLLENAILFDEDSLIELPDHNLIPVGVDGYDQSNPLILNY